MRDVKNRVSAQKRMTALLVIFASGCVLGKDREPDLGSTTQYALAHNALAHNALAHNALAHNALAHNKLAQSGLTGLTDAERCGLIYGPDGDGDPSASLFAYMVSCALEANGSLVLSCDGTDHTFPGLVGLAPSLKDSGLDTSAQRWVTSCILSRVNFYQIAVLLDLRGDHDAIRVPTPQWTIPDGTFYGNLWDSSDHLFACHADVPGVPNGGSFMSSKRKCDEEDPERYYYCRPIKTQGDCLADGICEAVDPSNGAVLRCHGSDGITYDESITAYLHQDLSQGGLGGTGTSGTGSTGSTGTTGGSTRR